ncbi:hypothetical protein ABPG75_005646 [Micractinium tetrahymenae]
MAADSSQQTELPSRGRRSSRRPRADYSGMMAALCAEENEHPNPDTPVDGGTQRKRHAPAAFDAEQPSQAQAAACQEPAEAQQMQQQQQQQHQQHQQQQQQSTEAAPPQARRQRGAAAAAVAAIMQAVETESDTEDGEEQTEDDEGEDAVAQGGRAAASQAVAADALAQPQRQRKRRTRVLVDVHGGAGPGMAAAAASGAACELQPEDVENEYERQRLERIRRNEQMLRQLGVADAAGGLAAAVHAEHRQQAAAASGAAGFPRPRPAPRERRPALPAAALPARKSKRQRGERPLAVEEAVAEAVAELGAGGGADQLSGAAEADPEVSGLLDLEAYFQLIGQDISGAVHTDGRYLGWVSPDVCERYGIPPDPDAAWEAGGGGKFSFKIDKKAIPAGLKGRGWSDARAFSHTQLLKNPNAYFYRHVAPHEQQAQGEWTEEEHRLFVETARAHGVGDKWGLFASHLPQRVGYQCSAYYRDVIIPAGLVIDKRFKMTRTGKAVYVG